MPTKKIIIVDDHGIFRTGLMVSLQRTLQSSHILEVPTVEDALQKCSVADVVLMDVGVELIQAKAMITAIKSTWASCKLIVLSAMTQAEGAQFVGEAAADYFLSKSLPSAQFLADIIEQIEGIKGGVSAHPKFTLRQLETLSLMSKGLTNKMIAKELGISEHTVRWHVQHILTTLDSSSRSEAIFNARIFGFIH